MNELPQPLTPPDCDLSDFQYMELDVRRLRDSKFAASVDGEAFRAGVLLWCAAWHQIPAGSLPDDDIELANLAGYGRVVKEWKKVRAEALTGFVKCSDGRLYHTVIAEKALSAYEAKLRHAYGKMCDRIRKENAKRTKENQPIVGTPTFEQWKSSGQSDGIPQESKPDSAGIPAENVLKGNGEGTEREQNGEGDLLNSVPNGTGGQPPDDDGENPKTAAEMTKTELWRAGKSLLLQAGMPKDQCGTFVGKLCKDYTDEIVIDAVRSAVVEQPADPASFLKAACMARKGEGGKTLMPWHATDAGVIAKGAELGIAALPGETGIQFKTRVIAAVDNGGKQPAPKQRHVVVVRESVEQIDKDEKGAIPEELRRTMLETVGLGRRVST